MKKIQQNFTNMNKNVIPNNIAIFIWTKCYYFLNIIILEFDCGNTSFKISCIRLN